MDVTLGNHCSILLNVSCSSSSSSSSTHNYCAHPELYSQSNKHNVLRLKPCSAIKLVYVGECVVNWMPSETFALRGYTSVYVTNFTSALTS